MGKVVGMVSKKTGAAVEFADASTGVIMLTVEPTAEWCEAEFGVAFDETHYVYSVVRSRVMDLPCCAVLCCAVLCCAVLCCAVLCCAVLCCAVL
jgi:hypothetical protein